MFGQRISNQKITFWVSLGHLSIFLIDAKNSFLKKASRTYFKSWRQDPETTKFFKNMVKIVDCMKWIVLPYLESNFEENTC